MDREAMLTKLGEHGVNGEEMAGADDKALAEHLRSLDAKDADAPKAENFDEEPEMPDDDEGKKAFAEKCMKMKAYAERGLMKCSDKPADMAKPEDVAKYGEAAGQIVAMRHELAELRKTISADVKGSIGQLQKFAEDEKRVRKEEVVALFCESRREKGLITPAQLDRSDPSNIFDELMRLDNREVVSKFSEGGKPVQATALDLRMRQIDRGRAHKFGQVIRAGGSAGADDAEVAKVERFSESPELAHALAAAGRPASEYVERFKELRKARPALTAREYGVPEQA